MPKISALPSATTPLSGTELVPVVQDGITKRVVASEIGATPTGTGFAHYTSGSLDPAAVGETGTGDVVRATSPALTTPDIGAATGTSVALSSYCSLGASAASAGDLRLPAGGTIYGVAPGPANARLVRYSDGGTYVLEFGETTFVGNMKLSTSAAPTAGFAFDRAGSTVLKMQADSTDFLSLGGPSPATVGYLRFPYNGGSAYAIIKVKDSGGTDRSILEFGAGDAYRLGSIAFNGYVDALALQLVANGGSFSAYANAGGFTFYSYVRSAYVMQLGSSSDYVSFGAAPPTSGYLRMDCPAATTTSLLRIYDGNYAAERDAIRADITNSQILFGNTNTHDSVVYGYRAYVDGTNGVYLRVNGSTVETVTSTEHQSTVRPAGTLADLSTIGHRLTLTTGTPVTTADVTAASTLYLSPFTSGQIALYDGTRWVQYVSGEVSLALSSLTSGKNYDVFAYYSSGVVLELLAWTSDTARATALTTQDGVLVKSGDATRRYLGTIRTTSTTTTEDSYAKRFVWNYYNRQRREMRVVETTDSWTGTGAGTFRAYNNTSANSVAFVQGIDSQVEVDGLGCAFWTAVGQVAMVGIGVDSTSTNSANLLGGGSTIANGFSFPTAHYRAAPGLGYHLMTLLERCAVAATYYGDQGNTYFQAGIYGSLFG